MMYRFRLILPLLLAILPLACSRKAKEESFTKDEYGQLSLLQQTHHVGLQKELARLISERATPALLVTDRELQRQTASATGETAIPHKRNVAKGLLEVCTPQLLDMLDRESAKLFPYGGFQFSPEELVKVIRFRKSYDEVRIRYRNALKRPQCDFGIKLTDGLAIDTSYLKVALIGNRLEAFFAAEMLYEHKLDAAIESLQLMFRMVRLALTENHLVYRNAAAHLRKDAFDLLAAIAQHRKATPITLKHLQEIVNAQLVRWPADENAWIADRAVGMHTYEMIRDGYMLSILTLEEIREFDREGSAKGIADLAMKSVDDDELFYLFTMRKVIESCSQPYYQRIKVFENVRKHLQTTRDTIDFPIVAGIILLTDLQQGHEIQAKDRALCEAWAIAFSEGNGPHGKGQRQSRPKYDINPLTGKPYVAQIDKHQVKVSGIYSDNPQLAIILPRLSSN